MHIAIYSRTSSDVDAANLQKLLDQLQRHQIVPVLYKAFYDLAMPELKGHQDHAVFSRADELDERIEFMISMGGDGTLLESVCYVKDKDIPIIGINFGRLGFLSEIGKNDMEELVLSLINRTYQIERRTLIHLDSNQPLFDDIPYGLNEFAIHKKDTSAMIKIHTFLNGEFLNTYWADGLIIATPTGSTGYSLSCGGPIIFPDAANFVITPVAPHNLNARPIVVPDHNVISFEIEGRSDQFLCTLDARIEVVDNQIQLAVRKEAFTLGLLRRGDSNFLTTLRNKLLWGIDKRN